MGHLRRSSVADDGRSSIHVLRADGWVSGRPTGIKSLQPLTRRIRPDLDIAAFDATRGPLLPDSWKPLRNDSVRAKIKCDGAPGSDPGGYQRESRDDDQGPGHHGNKPPNGRDARRRPMLHRVGETQAQRYSKQ